MSHGRRPEAGEGAEPTRSGSDRIAACLLALTLASSLAMWLAIRAAADGSGPGGAHPTLPGLQVGGNAIGPAARTAAWAFGAFQVAFFAAALALGLRGAASAGAGHLALWTGALVHQLAWLAIVVTDALTLGDAHRLWLGLPPATALMVFVFWPLPVAWAGVYVAGFDRLVWNESEQRRFDDALSALRAHPERVDPAGVDRGRVDPGPAS